MNTIILSLLLATSLSNPADSGFIHEGYGTATFTIPLSELGTQAEWTWKSQTWLAYTKVSVTDEAGHSLYSTWGWGLLLFDQQKVLDLSEATGDHLTVTIEGRRTHYSFSLHPVED